MMPERVGRYEILLPIASGGMAQVYLARTRGAGGFEREVAVKLTHGHLRESAEFAADLIEEAKLAARIRHPNVVAVLDVGDDPHGLFLVMDYVEGETLSGLSKRSAAAGRPLPPAIGLRILCDALAGLHAAHELRDEAGLPLGLVHRDFSPQNILVGVDGMARLADFGIAKAATRLSHTRTGNVKGKIAYMSPEQARGQPIDRRCDVWAAGAVAWELLAGHRLFVSDNEVALLLKIVSEPAPLLSEVGVPVPAALEQAVASALTAAAEARCPTAAELARRIVAACRASGWALAELEEVGEHVRQLAGSKLATRRARAGEILGLRAQMGQAAHLSHDVLTPASTEVGPLAALAASREPAAPTGQLPSARGTLGDATWPDEPPSSTDALPTQIRGDPPRPRLAPVTSAQVPEHTLTDTATVTTRGRLEALLRGRSAASQRRLVLAGGTTMLLVLGGVGGLWWSLSSPQPGPAAPTDSPPAESTPIGAGGSGSPASSAAARASASPSGSRASDAAAATVSLTANAAVARIELNGRKVTPSPPVSELEIELSAEEARSVLRVKAVSSDGRVTSVKLNPGQKEAKILFPTAETGGSRTPPLADNPYKRK
jgi:eukaryotic-like serine/threonine-protein kinase